MRTCSYCQQTIDTAVDSYLRIGEQYFCSTWCSNQSSTPSADWVEYSFLIPIVRNDDGRLHVDAVWQRLERELCEQFDGFTWQEGFYGVWRDDSGRLVKDSSRKYIVALPSKKIPRLRRLAAQCCHWFHQDCVYLTQTGTHAELLTGGGL